LSETVSLLAAGPPDAGAVLLLAHGAGAAMDSPFMNLVAELLAARGVATLRFEFGYMALRRMQGKRRPPPRAETLVGEYKSAVEAARERTKPSARIFVGGKSMGGRVASLLVDELVSEKDENPPVRGLVCLGYPFHPPGKPEQLRTAHLETLTAPALIVQGERDPFGSRPEVEAMSLSRAIAFHWAPDGDHDLGPRGGSGFTRKGNLAAAADAIAAFTLVAGTGNAVARPGRRSAP